MSTDENIPVTLKFGEDESAILGQLTVESEKVLKRSGLLIELFNNANDKRNLLISLKNFKYAFDVFSFLQHTFNPNGISLSVARWNTDWLEYTLYFQVDQAVAIFTKLAGDCITEVLDHYTTKQVDEYREERNPSNASMHHYPYQQAVLQEGKDLYRKETVYQKIKPLNDEVVTRFWTIVDMACKHEALRHLIAGDFPKKLRNCPQLNQFIPEPV